MNFKSIYTYEQSKHVLPVCNPRDKNSFGISRILKNVKKQVKRLREYKKRQMQDAITTTTMKERRIRKIQWSVIGMIHFAVKQSRVREL